MAKHKRRGGEPKGMPIKVMSTFPGVWARFRGVDRAGRPVDVSGAVVGGPDKIRRGQQLGLAVLVRTYHGDGVSDGPDVLVITGRDADCWLRDTKRDHAARARWAADPVLGPVDLSRVDVAVCKGDPDDPAALWPVQTRSLTPQQFTDLEWGRVPGERLSGVFRLRVPTGAFQR